MALALPIFGAVFFAICVWLTVRIVNNPERWAIQTASALRWLFAVGFLMLALGGYMASISEWYRGKPRDDKDSIQMKQTAILLILPGGGSCICSAVAFYVVEKRR